METWPSPRLLVGRVSGHRPGPERDPRTAGLPRAPLRPSFPRGRLQAIDLSIPSAQPEIFQDFRDRFDAAGRHALTENYRSVPEILQFVNALFATTFPDPDTALQPRVPSLEQSAQPAIEFVWADEADGENPADPKPSATRVGSWRPAGLPVGSASDWRRAGKSVTEVGEMSGDAHPGDIAFLFRAMTDVGPYESALDEEGFDYHTVGGAAFYVQQEVTDLINVLSPSKTRSIKGAGGTLRSPFFCLSDDGLFWLATARPNLVEGLEHADRIDELPDLDRQQACRAVTC